MKTTLAKKQSKAFEKDIYLLGEDQGGTKYWLEEPSFDCGWYWGFGYVETYTYNNRPDLAKDSASHQHIDGLLGQQTTYDFEKKCFVVGDYIHNLYDNPLFAKTTFTSKEGWKLSELFQQFYLLRKMADFAHKELPGCNITTSPVDHGDMKNWYSKINNEMIPRITSAILEILS